MTLFKGLDQIAKRRRFQHLYKLELPRIWSPCTILNLKTLIRSQKLGFLVLMETRLTNQCFCFLKAQLGFSKRMMLERIGLGGTTNIIVAWRFGC